MMTEILPLRVGLSNIEICISFLIKYDVDVNSKNNSGHTALYYATTHNKIFNV